MSLNGLDDVKIKQAHDAAISEPGGWFLLKYIARDEVELLARGNGGIVDVRNSIAQYEDPSPLYGFLRYRRRNVLIKYVPEDCSRLVQARVTVHFHAITERFSPCDTIFPIAASKELKDSTLSAACSLHTASGSASSSTSSLRQRRLMEIAEDTELENKIQESSPPEDLHDDPSASKHERVSTSQSPATDQVQETASSITRKATAADAESSVSSYLPDPTSEARPKSPTKTLDERRQSSQSFRPDFYSYSSYGSNGKPKVKLGPRPSLDISGRLSSSSSGTHRQVSTLPAGLKLVSKSPKRSRDRPQTYYSTEMPAMPLSPPPIPTSFFANSDAPPVRPHTSGGHPTRVVPINSSMPLNKSGSKAQTMTPEKARLMKALQMRKKQLDSPAPKQPLPLLTKDETSVSSKSEHQSVHAAPKEVEDALVMLNEMAKADTMVTIESSSLLAEAESDATRTSPDPISSVETSEAAQSTQASSISDSTDETVQPSPNNDEHGTVSDEKIDHDLADRKQTTFLSDHALRDKDTEDKSNNNNQNSSDDLTTEATSETHNLPTHGQNLGEEEIIPEKTEQVEKLSVTLPRSGKSEEVNMIKQHTAEVQELIGISFAHGNSLSTTPTVGDESQSITQISGLQGQLSVDQGQDANAISLPKQSAASLPQPVTLIRGSELESPEVPEEEDGQTPGNSVALPLGSTPPVRERRMPRSKFSVHDLKADRIPNSQGSLQDLSTPSTPVVRDDGPFIMSEKVATDEVTPAEDIDSPAGSTFPMVTSPSTAEKNHDTDNNTQSQKKRRALVEPVRIDVPPMDKSGNNSENEFLSDDDLLDELQSATVQEAQPISVSKSPMNSVFPSPTQGDHGSLRSVSNPALRSTSDSQMLALPHDAQAVTNRSASSSAAYLNRINQSHSKPLVTKVNIGSSISKRIKALEKLNGLAGGPGAPSGSSTPPPGSPAALFPRDSSIRRPSRSPSIQERANSLTGNTPPPTRSCDSSPEAIKVRNRSGSSHSRLGSLTSVATDQPPQARPESVSVTARIVRDLNQPTLQKPQTGKEPSNLGRLDLKRSPLIIDHQAAIFAPPKEPIKEIPNPNPPRLLNERRSSMDIVRDFISDSRSSFSESRRKSLVIERPNRSSSRPSSTQQNSPNLSRPHSVCSRHSMSSRDNSVLSGRPTLSPTSSEDISEKKPGSRASRMLRRVSSSLSASRKSLLHAVSPTVREESEPIAPSKLSTDSRTSTAPTAAVEVGDVNVQFPDTLLWKRRNLKLDSRGFLTVSPVQESKGMERSAVTKRYHLADFRLPFVPDMELEEMPNSVVLDFVETGGLQIACQDRTAQLSILNVLQDAHRSWATHGQ
ncbi:MAG: hypothetical protein M1818_003435 [Claussenomyces sp. TS43310]|nr:MAG: hypothetical protein M1818_003435 [Claussenomyces sp. TS43310]